MKKEIVHLTDFQREKVKRDSDIVKKFNSMKGMVTVRYQVLADEFGLSISSIQRIVEKSR